MDTGKFSHAMPESEPTDEYRYWKLTWPQVNAAVEAGKTVVIPVGSTEDHGHHLPLDVDQVLPETICETAVRERDDALLFQTIPHGYLPHHMDYPGGITIRWDTFVNYLIDVGVSLCHHGFRRLLFVNGHGSNHHLVEQATRQVNLQYPGARAAMISWWEIEELREAAAELREAGPEGGDPVKVGQAVGDLSADFRLSDPAAYDRQAAELVAMFVKKLRMRRASSIDSSRW